MTPTQKQQQNCELAVRSKRRFDTKLGFHADSACSCSQLVQITRLFCTLYVSALCKCKDPAFSGDATYLRQEEDEVEHAEHPVAGLLHGGCGQQERQSVSEVPRLEHESTAHKCTGLPRQTMMAWVQIRKAARFVNLLYFRDQKSRSFSLLSRTPEAIITRTD